MSGRDNAAGTETVDTLIVSDVHFGSELCQASLLLQVLQKFSFKRLILNGDMFDHLHFEPERKLRHNGNGHVPRPKKRRLKESHLETLKFIRDLSDPARDCEVVWVEGNHDEGLSVLWTHVGGPTVREEYRWEYGGKQFAAIHGDQFDTFNKEHRNLVIFATRFYRALQYFGPRAHAFCWYLKRSSKKYIHAITGVAEQAFAYARKAGIDTIFCGHTHHAEYRDDGNIEYYNSGSWTEDICSCITIGAQGVRVHQYRSNDGHAKLVNIITKGTPHSL